MASASSEALRSSPMVPAQDATDDVGEDGAMAAAAGGGLGLATAGGVADDAAAVGEEDRRDRDTRLSRVSAPKVAGPRLRSS